MISRAGLLTVASVLALASMACSSSSSDAGAGGAANAAGTGNNPGGNPGGNGAPLAAGVLGPDPAPDSTDPAPNATDPAPSATDPAPNATDPAPTATDLPVGVGGVNAPGSTGGGDLGGAPDCNTLCNSISASCAVPQDLLDQCIEGCHEALEDGCYVEMAQAVACAAAAACAAQGNVDAIEAACSDAFQAVDCNGGGVVVQPGQGEGGQPSVPAGGSGCAGLQACCNSLDAETATTCQETYNGVSAGGDAACNGALMIFQGNGLCP